MTLSAPAAIALARSPEYLMPPSAMTGTPAARAASAQSMIAVSCGTPTPATMRVVQIEPGPMPTLIASAPASISALVAVGGRDIAGDERDLVGDALEARDLIEHGLRMAMGGVDDDAVDAGVDQQFGALIALVADGRGGGDAQASLGVLAGQRMQRRLLHILDRDEADAAEILVDDEQLFEPVLVQKAARLVLAARLRAR